MSITDLNSATAHARSVLARAASAHVTWLDPDMTERHDSLVTPIYLDHPERPTPGDRSPVVLEIADPAPVAVRHRLRATVRLHGDAARIGDSEHGIRIRPVSAELESGGASLSLDPRELWLAEPDPLALVEGPVLGHLDTRHPETVAMLARLLPEEVRADARRIAPVSLDRNGIVLRLEYAVGHLDVRLAFPDEVTHPAQVADALADLLGIARCSCSSNGKARRRGLLAPLFEAGPAAARICAPDGLTSTRDPSARRSGPTEDRA